MKTKIEYKDNTENIGLKKWPGFAVSGEKITEDQASEILIRTDCFFPSFSYSTNDHVFNQELEDIFGGHDDTDYEWSFKIREKINWLNLKYLSNKRIASAYVGGPHGWCDWKGNIFCNSFNIGKWPEVSSVAEDWKLILENFPFLNLTCQLFDNEIGENPKAIVEIIVKNGSIVVREPGKSFDLKKVNISYHSLMNLKRERGIDVPSLKNKIKKVFGEIPKVS